MDPLTRKFPLQSERDEKIQARFIVGKDADGRTCGEFLKSCGVSRRLTVKLKRTDGGILCGGKFIRTCDKVFEGDVLTLGTGESFPLEPNYGLYVPAVYEDSDVIVFDKPAGMAVHPSIKHRDDTLGNYFSALFPQLTFRPINRLDKDTSGLCAVAKSPYAANMLSGKISKVYFAAAEGVPIPHETGLPNIEWYCSDGEYVIDAPIGRVGDSLIKREVRPDGKRAVTRYTILKSSEKHSLLRIVLETGRTHQIRVHFSSLGYPLAGDDFYGGSLDHCKEQALHCGEMRFFRPSDGKREEIFSEIRPDMAKLFAD